MRKALRTLRPEDERLIRDAAAHEWDVGPWAMPRAKFIQWHVDMATGTVR